MNTPPSIPTWFPRFLIVALSINTLLLALLVLLIIGLGTDNTGYRIGQGLVRAVKEEIAAQQAQAAEDWKKMFAAAPATQQPK